MVECLPAPLRLYFVKSIKWQVEAVFRDEVIAALCCSKSSRFSGDEAGRGRTWHLSWGEEGREKKEAARGRRRMSPASRPPVGRKWQLITVGLSTHRRTVRQRSIVGTADDFLLPAGFEAQEPLSRKEKIEETGRRRQRERKGGREGEKPSSTASPRR